MSVLPSLATQARQRMPPPSVPPPKDRADFESEEAYKAYMATRSKAKEQLREFNRPTRAGRIRSAGVAQPTAASQALSKAVEDLRKRERRILFGVYVETGLKKAPSSADFDAWGGLPLSRPPQLGGGEA